MRYKEYKASGPDKISFRFLKDSLNGYNQLFSEIIKVYFDLETRESDSDTQYGDQEVASNNRLISLLAALSKVCDKVVVNQFTAYLTT